MSRDAILPVYGPPSVVFERGEGPRLFADDGRTYLDFISGISVNALGHSHPQLIAALKDQADKIWHLSNMYRVPGQERLSERYAADTFADRVFFSNSGAEAIECAIKTARKYHYVNGDEDRYEILSFEGSFHGRTLGAVNAGANPKYREGFGPAMPGFTHLPFGDEDALKAAMGPNVAAVLVEPVQGEGGVRAIPEEALTNLRKLCDEHGALLIYDEVQSGAGRTGKLFAYEWAENADPDIMAVAKGVGGGFPMGACLMTEEASKGMKPGSHGSTFGGGPLAMAVGNAVWDVLTSDGFLEEVNRVSASLTQGLSSLKDRYPDLVVELRGKGLLRGIKLSRDPAPIRAAAMERGLLVGTAGDQVVRLAPPLIITDADVREAVDVLDQALASVSEPAK
ncbi:MAG: aspartate aminotransferase family protein [Pseudomonadota bacterium]